MTTTNRPRRYFTPPPASEPIIGDWLAALEEARGRTKAALTGIDQATLDWQPPRDGNGIGTLLYHIAAIEADWLSVEVREEPDYPPELVALFPHEVREATGRLTVVTGLDLAAHLARLDAVRAQLLGTFSAMSLADFTRIRVLPQYDVTPQWVVHHLLQHEAEHRGEIGYDRLLANPVG
ncbi:MAG TPA: DinB family protein [Thermomicrobiales bacterium]|jgi:uncharacterized damage-inducible protein DinB